MSEIHRIPHSTEASSREQDLQSPNSPTIASWRPANASTDEARMATVARFARRFINKDGKAFSVEDLKSVFELAAVAEAKDYADQQALRWAVWTNSWDARGVPIMPSVRVTFPAAFQVQYDTAYQSFGFPQPAVPDEFVSLSFINVDTAFPFYPQFTVNSKCILLEFVGNADVGNAEYRTSFPYWLEQLATWFNEPGGALSIAGPDPEWTNEELITINTAIQPLLGRNWGIELPGLPVPWLLDDSWTQGDNTADTWAVVTRGELVSGVYVPQIDGSLWIQRDNVDIFSPLVSVWPTVNNDLGGSATPPYNAATDRTIFAGVGYFKLA